MNHELLETMSACREAREFASRFETLQEAWDACERPDWLLWFAGRRVDRKKLVEIACEIARTALPYTKDERVLKCIEVTEAWTRGEATVEQVRESRCLARHAAAYADYAAYAAAYADYATDYAAEYAADYAAYAAACATDADAAADYATDAARKEATKLHCTIIRRHLPKLP